MPDVLNVHNTSPIVRWAPGNGERHLVPPYGTTPFPAEIAKEIVARNKPHCVLQDDRPYDPEWTGPLVWLANITGSDLLPKEVPTQQRQDGKLVTVMVPNPHLAPTLVKRDIDGGQQEANGKFGSYLLNLPSKTAAIWPYSRKAFPPSVAMEMLARDSMMRFRGQIVKCEAPGQCEPDSSWPYEEIRDYLAIVDSDAVREFPATEDEVRKDCGDMDPGSAVIMAKHFMVAKAFHRIVAGYDHPKTHREFAQMRGEPKASKKKS